MPITCLIIIAEGRNPSPSSALVDDSVYFQIEVPLFFSFFESCDFLCCHIQAEFTFSLFLCHHGPLEV